MRNLAGTAALAAAIAAAFAGAACSSPSAGPETEQVVEATASENTTDAPPAKADDPQPTVEGAPDAAPALDASGPFAGSWQACGDADAPDQCSRYALQQRGDRICGTWFYFASGAGYEGRVIARASSPKDARRTQVCGRAGSETSTACDAGWEAIDKPLRVCDGKLGDLDGKDGACFADYARVPDADAALEALAAEPWMQACLAGDAGGTAP